MNTPLTWSEKLSLIRKNTKVKHGRGCDEPTVDAAEQALELNFPESYKQFLLTVGWLDFDGDEIFGLGDDLPEPYMNVVSKTTDERNAINLPKCFLVISQTYTGNLVCLNTAETVAGECPVVFVRFCPVTDMKILSASFLEFIKSFLLYGIEPLTENAFVSSGKWAIETLTPITWREHRQRYYQEAQRLFETHHLSEQKLVHWHATTGRPWACDLKGLEIEARLFLQAHAWCRSVRSLSLRKWVEGIFALFHAEIEPTPGSDADEAVWVIVGDLPPAYLDIPSIPTVREALEAYISLLEEWVEAVRKGEPTDELMPIYYRHSLIPVPPTLLYAEMVTSRAQLLESILNDL